MSNLIDVNFVESYHKFTQKCFIPLNFLETTQLKTGDFVLIKSNVRLYVCKIFCTFHPGKYITVDDIVTSNSAVIDMRKETVSFPDCFSFIKPSIFERLQIQVILEDDSPFPTLNKINLEKIISKIISPFIFGKHMSINCKYKKLSKLFHIHSIVIAETFTEENVFGKLTRATAIEIIDISTNNQVIQLKEIKLTELGGLDDCMNYLKSVFLLSHHENKRLLILGPTGSGKTTLVKKFCCDVNSIFLLIDGRIDDLNVLKLDRYFEYLNCSSKIFPARNIILFIDHIDILTPLDLNSKTIESTSKVVHFIKKLSNINVFVVAATTYRNQLHPFISFLFDEEVVLNIPTCDQRKKIFEVFMKPLLCKIDCGKLARSTPGFVGHDIKLLIEEAKRKSRSMESDLNEEAFELTTSNVEEALLSYTPFLLKASKWSMKVKPVYWEDIGGMSSIKERLQMGIEWPLQNPEIFRKVNLPCPHGVLLFGPPGCCKTTLARGLATACNANFFAANPAQIYSPFVGESEKNISELFFQARLCAPSIIFLDELDCLVAKRSFDNKSQGVGEKVLSTLLNEMDGFGIRTEFHTSLKMQKLINCNKRLENEEEYQNDQVIVVAATNRPDLIDDALLRPGRFDIIIYVPAPNAEERESILLTITKSMPVENINFKRLASETEFYSGADLKNLCNRAAMNALRNNMAAQFVTEENFRQALENMLPSITRKQINKYEKLSNKYGPIVR